MDRNKSSGTRHGLRHVGDSWRWAALNTREPPGCPQRLARCVAMWCDAQRRVVERCDAPRRAALPTVMSISPTRPIDQGDMAGREATSRQRCCRMLRKLTRHPATPGLTSGLPGVRGPSSSEAPSEPTLSEKPRLMEITGRGFLKKEVPSWAAAPAGH